MKRLDRTNKKHKGLKIFGIILAIIVVLILIIILLAYSYLNNKLEKLQYETITNNLEELGINENNKINKYRNIALLGLDAQYDTYDTDYRTDCIMVASINEETSEVDLYSIYRDTYVQIEENRQSKNG